MRQDLLDEINSLADSLANVSSWKTSKDAFGHIIIESKGIEKVAKKDYIYEFYCYMKIIEDLNKKTNQNIKFVIGNGIFPRNPASKTNRPYFVLEKDNSELFQICSGTQIQTIISDFKKAPDISFQKISSDPDLPNYEDVIAIYDAKYSESSSLKSFQEGQMVLFSDMIRLLNLQIAGDLTSYYTNFNEFKGNCLVTNKKSFTSDLNLLNYYKMVVIEDFDEVKKFRVI